MSNSRGDPGMLARRVLAGALGLAVAIPVCGCQGLSGPREGGLRTRWNAARARIFGDECETFVDGEIIGPAMLGDFETIVVETSPVVIPPQGMSSVPPGSIISAGPSATPHLLTHPGHVGVAPPLGHPVQQSVPQSSFHPTMPIGSHPVAPLTHPGPAPLIPHHPQPMMMPSAPPHGLAPRLVPEIAPAPIVAAPVPHAMTHAPIVAAPDPRAVTHAPFVAAPPNYSPAPALATLPRTYSPASPAPPLPPGIPWAPGYQHTPIPYSWNAPRSLANAPALPKSEFPALQKAPADAKTVAPAPPVKAEAKTEAVPSPPRPTPGALGNIEPRTSKNVVAVGEEFLYTFGVHNTGGSAIDKVEISVILGDNLRALSVQPDGVANIVGNKVIFQPLAPFTPMVMRHFDIRLRAEKQDGGAGLISLEVNSPILKDVLRKQASVTIIPATK